MWLKFVQFGGYIPLGGIALMTPILLTVSIYGIILYIKEKRERVRGKEEFGEKLVYQSSQERDVFAIIFCDRCKIHFEKYFTRDEMLRINQVDVPCCKYRKRLFRKLE